MPLHYDIQQLQSNIPFQNDMLTEDSSDEEEEIQRITTPNSDYTSSPEHRDSPRSPSPSYNLDSNGYYFNMQAQKVKFCLCKVGAGNINCRYIN